MSICGWEARSALHHLELCKPELSKAPEEGLVHMEALF